MRLLKVRVLGLAGALALLCSFGLVTQARPAAAAGPSDAPTPVSVTRSHVSLTTQTVSPTVVAQATHSGWGHQYAGQSIQSQKIGYRWSRTGGGYCKDASGGQVYVPTGMAGGTGLTC